MNDFSQKIIKMKRFNFLISAFSLILLFGLSSCTKEKGCTDPASPTYNADAEKDDGSCESVADVLSSSPWVVARSTSANNNGEIWTADISMVDDNTISITMEDEFSNPRDSFDLEANWQDKTLTGSALQDLEGTITDEKKFELTYVQPILVGFDTIYLSFTRN